MGTMFSPALVLAIFLAVFSVQVNQINKATRAAVISKNINNASQFIAYKNAVAVYVQNNPTFTGSIPAGTLTAQGYQFSSEFLALTNNQVTTAGTSGRTITCYSNLPSGTINEALELTSYDASLGIASGGNWTSYAQGTNQTASPLPVAVPNNYIVSVIQIGS
ncbi:type IV pilus biogenesis protein PilM [Methylotenera sp.]|uniref:type IV pilus biogenesis protein PilM n=1 Tax=Methylotenera sp. TaxID=2051956 RepID=UPI002ED82AEB